MPVNSGQIVELRIDDVAYRGSGVARRDGLVCFVRSTLPGETVRARVTKLRKNMAEAELLEVLAPAPERISPACDLAPVCPCCCYQHVSYETELTLKQKQFADLMARLGGAGAVSFREPIGSPAPLGYRNRITLHMKGKADKCAVGYFADDNKSIIDVKRCPLAKEPLNELIAELRSRGELTASPRYGSSVTLRWTDPDGAVYWTENKKPPGKYLTEKTMLGDIVVPARSFFQVNPLVVGFLLDSVTTLIKRIGPNALIDMYCGVGMFALAATAAGVDIVLGIDSDRHAVKAARSNARLLAKRGVRFVFGTAETLPSEALKTMVSARTTLVVDPPRTGLSREVIDIIGCKRPADLIYVSCAADTLARDVKLLAERDYAARETGLIDMFPRTHCFESVTHLQNIGNK